MNFKVSENDIYKIAKVKERKRKDIENIKFIKNEDGISLVNKVEIRNRWTEYFTSLFNENREHR